MEKLIEKCAIHVPVGSKIIGRKGWHLRVERAQHERGSWIKFTGVNDFGEEMVMRYRPRDMIEVFVEEKS